MYNIDEHSDFRRYFDTTQKRNYWVLGYFGGGSMNVVEVHRLAKIMASSIKVPPESIRVDEILKSRRYKGFKFLFSDAVGQLPDPSCTTFVNNVYQFLTD